MRKYLKTTNTVNYHLISGADLPIKSQEYIHAFFNANAGRNFVGFLPDKEANKSVILNKHIFPRHYKNSCHFIERMRDVLTRYLPVKSYDIEFKKGCNWVSITHECVLEILKHKDFFMKNFKYSLAIDEWYKQTVVYNSSLMNTVYSSEDEYKGCMRLIDWKRGNPYSWTIDDVQEILDSDRIFCRKISDEKLARFLYDKFAIK